jgi:hypothetical protein
MSRLPDEDLDREIRLFLVESAENVADAPSAMEVAMGVSSRVRSRGWRPFDLMPGLAWALIAGLLMVALAGALLAAARREQPAPPPVAYEAVFLRFGEARVGPGADVVVVGIDALGRERLIANLPDATFRHGFQAPMGAVSNTGLLALPSIEANFLFHWEILDLNHPALAPIAVAGIVQDLEQLGRTPFDQADPASRLQGGPLWGPDEQLLIAWYERNGPSWLSFVERRTGAISTVSSGRLPKPHWAADGSGVFVGSGREGLTFLMPDGSVTDRAVGIMDVGYSRRFRTDGEIAPKSARQLEGQVITDISWTAGGEGLWLAVRSGPDNRDLAVQRAVTGSVPMTAATLLDVGPSDETRMEGRFIGLAPDDSMLVLNTNRVTETSGTPVYSAGLIFPASGRAVEVPGTFAGWIKVVP